MNKNPASQVFLPTTPQEVCTRGWEGLDVILVTGDTYIDSPYLGAAVIGRVLLEAGYRVGIIAQPDVTSAMDITRLGEPALFWGVTGGSGQGTWCKPRQVKYNNGFYPTAFDTVVEMRHFACHEIGHTLGLVHFGNGCMMTTGTIICLRDHNWNHQYFYG